MTETFQSAVINYLRYKMVVTVWCGRARQVLTSALSSTSGMNRTADWVRPDGDHHVNMWRKDWTLQWSLKLTGCGVLLSVCFHYPESPAGTFKQGVPERDRQRERHRCEQTNLLILLQSNSAASQQTGSSNVSAVDNKRNLTERQRSVHQMKAAQWSMKPQKFNFLDGKWPVEWVQ